MLPTSLSYRRKSVTEFIDIEKLLHDYETVYSKDTRTVNTFISIKINYFLSIFDFTPELSLNLVYHIELHKRIKTPYHINSWSSAIVA